MKVKELKTLLSSAEAFLSASGAEAGAGALRDVCTILDGDGQETVHEFVEETLAALPEQLEAFSAQQIAARLDKLDTDDAAFVRLFAALHAKEVSNKKVIEVAALYLGGAARWKTKQAALKAIRSGYEDRAYQACKMVFVDKSTPW